MRKFLAVPFFEITRILQSFAAARVADEYLTAESELVKKRLPKLLKYCQSLELNLSAKYTARLIKELSTGKYTLPHFQRYMVRELQSRIRDEMEEQLFFHLDTEKAKYYERGERLFGKDVCDRWPKLTEDIAEAAKCLALSRPTACVFHLMRIMEASVQGFGDRIGVALTHEKNWQNILDEVNKAIKSLDQKSDSTKALAAVSANLYSVKLAWRNETMHPKATYTDEEAEDIWRCVKSFVRELSGAL